ncbi:Tyrosine-protein phosphatase non-receptor type substrate 1 [Fukomys damarensis]|uniref:Tyrosine-protein phosphatase non-receptor type substrate 1 n=1 Tax=Fukomys damarensis TaxID=885580 RepID=A0A091CQV6_FUKDA|nr:Tyrosine-protein phosphatase non-receptor type substrate 1 [Fukomys damarensis]
MFPIPGQVLHPLIAILLLQLTAGHPFISLMGPSQRVIPEISEPFNCTAGPFSSEDFNITWFKNSDEHPASAQYLVADNKGNYSITSKAWVTLTRDDVLSQITCEVAHGDLDEPLRMTMNLSQMLYIIPSLNITKSSETHHHQHQKVNLTCHVSHFYPSHLKLIWMKNGHKILEEFPEVTSNLDGTYSLEHMLLEEATLDGCEFACWVVQGDQVPVKAVINVQASSKNNGRMSTERISGNLEGPQQRFEPGTSIQLTYTLSRLRKNHVVVTCLKNNHKLPKPQTKFLPIGDTYNVTSTVSVPLTKDDVFSFVHCKVKQNSTLIFQKNISLSQYLRVPPAVTVSHSPVSSGLVAITCHVQRFYPDNVHLTWLEDCHILKGTEDPIFKNTDGSYTKKSSQLVNTSVQGPERVFTCRVQQEKQPTIQASLILPTALHTIHKSIRSSDSCPLSEEQLVNFFLHCLGCLLALLVISLALQKINTMRSHAAEDLFIKSSPMPMSLRVLLNLISSKFSVSVLIFRSLIHLDFSLVHGKR